MGVLTPSMPLHRFSVAIARTVSPSTWEHCIRQLSSCGFVSSWRKGFLRQELRRNLSFLTCVQLSGRKPDLHDDMPYRDSRESKTRAADPFHGLWTARTGAISCDTLLGIFYWNQKEHEEVLQIIGYFMRERGRQRRIFDTLLTHETVCQSPSWDGTTTYFIIDR